MSREKGSEKGAQKPAEGDLRIADQFSELARFPVLDGKTWNDPVLGGDVFLVRNGEEMAVFRLSLAGHGQSR
jgi:hypothetical protein